ncbi:MAG: hypothetical protein Aurels2KO_16920 [Aureliella sp.]
MLNWFRGRWATCTTLCLLAIVVLSLHRNLNSQTATTTQHPNTSAVSGGNIQVVSTLLANGTQQLVVTDTAARVMAVYHVDSNQGKLQLLSVRSLIWDLRMEEFNAQVPLPSELRAVQP